MHNMFTGEVLRYYNMHVEGRTQDYREAMDRIKQHHNSLSKQQNVKAELYSVRFYDIVTQANGNDLIDLRLLTTQTGRRFPLCSVEFKSDQHKVHFLLQEILQERWSNPILSKQTAKTEKGKMA